MTFSIGSKVGETAVLRKVFEPEFESIRCRRVERSRICHRPSDGSVVSSLRCMNDPQPEGHMASYIGRRKFLATLGGAAVAWPLAARAQQRAFPVIGLLSSRSPAVDTPFIAVIRQGLNETGLVEGQNIALDYRWAEGQYDRLAGLAADLVRQQ